jgi:hypothetical protein
MFLFYFNIDFSFFFLLSYLFLLISLPCYFSDGDTLSSEMDMKINHEKNRNTNNKKTENLTEKNDTQKPYRNERKECISDVAKHLNTVENLISNNNNNNNNYNNNNYTPSKSLFTSSAQEIMFRRMHHISLNKPTSSSTSTSKSSHLKSEQKSENENENDRNSTTR